MAPTVLIADDDGVSRKLLRRLLEQEGYAVRAAADGVEALELFAAEPIDIVLLDIVMPGLDGIAATAALLARHPALRVVLVSVHEDPALAERGYAAGALGYVSKQHAGHELVPAVRAALRGERYLSPHIRRLDA